MRLGGGWPRKGGTRDVSDVKVLVAAHLMLTRMDHRSDFYCVLEWVDKVWDDPLLLKECVLTTPRRGD